MLMTITAHNKAEWMRMAQDAYNLHLTHTGNRYNAAASMIGDTIPIAVFDQLQDGYRRWLIQGFGKCA